MFGLHKHIAHVHKFKNCLSPKTTNYTILYFFVTVKCWFPHRMQCFLHLSQFVGGFRSLSCIFKYFCVLNSPCKPSVGCQLVTVLLFPLNQYIFIKVLVILLTYNIVFNYNTVLPYLLTVSLGIIQSFCLHKGLIPQS